MNENNLHHVITGKTLRSVTCWDEVSFVRDADLVHVHEFDGGKSGQALWIDARGQGQELGRLTEDEVAKIRMICTSRSHT